MKGAEVVQTLAQKEREKTTQPGKHPLLHREGSVALNSITLSRLPDTHHNHSSKPGV